MKKSFYGKNFKLGVLGGGQLGRMLIQETINYNVSVHILDPSADAPCSAIADSFTVGDFRKEESVYTFGKGLDLITIEIEDVNVAALKRLRNEGVSIYPSPEIIEMVQDKGLQKSFYKEHNLPTSAFQLIENKAEISKTTLSFPLFQKLRKGGYDGRGVCKIQDENSTSNAFDAPSVLEEKVRIAKEISVIVARNASGEIKAYPPVEMLFNEEANLVEFLFSPAEICTENIFKATELAKKLAEKIELVGILAVEMFLSTEGEILINEIAPRTHNSGHQSIEGNYTSQFEQHLRAILNLPLGNTDIILPSVMINLLGEKGYSGEAKIEGIEKALQYPGLYIHLYGKKETKPFRKMGHINIVNQDLEKAKAIAKEVLEIVKIKA